MATTIDKLVAKNVTDNSHTAKLRLSYKKHVLCAFFVPTILTDVTPSSSKTGKSRQDSHFNRKLYFLAKTLAPAAPGASKREAEPFKFHTSTFFRRLLVQKNCNFGPTLCPHYCAGWLLWDYPPMWWSLEFSDVKSTLRLEGNKSGQELTTYSRSPLSRMGTHRSTTTNQQVGLRITEMCREASKVTQNDVGEEQQKADIRGEAASWGARRFLSHRERTRWFLRGEEKKRGKKTFSLELHAEKSGDSSFPLSKNVPRSNLSSPTKCTMWLPARTFQNNTT